MAKVTWGPQILEVPAKKLGKAMVPPAAPGGNGSIFVSLVSYRDGERCGRTIKSIFDNAKNPDNVIVGIVEQNAPGDMFCIEQYCKLHGVETIKRDEIRDDTTRIVRQENTMANCPHAKQIRLLAVHHFAAKGPMHARSLMRKLLGNEEFCLQLDAHSSVASGWDSGLTAEWHLTHNEFAVISTVPPPQEDQALYEHGGNGGAVPRQCQVKFRDNGIPDYESPADASVEGLTSPLLSHAWSAAFSFAKCHLEETVPYDPFSHYAMPIEQFGRFARMWTRGYDVYTPTRNYVFHDYGPQGNGHGDLEWFKINIQNRFRVMAIDRAKLMLEITSLAEASDTLEADRANLGIYGLGQRRSLEQLQSFCNIKLNEKQGNDLAFQGICVGHDFVPYEASISPLANLHHDGATKLDPHPLFPLRTDLVFSTVDVTSAEAAKHLFQRLDTAHLEIAVNENPKDGVVVQPPNVHMVRQQLQQQHHGHHHAGLGPEILEQVNLPPSSVLFVLWVVGLVMWCVVFAVPNSSVEKSWLSKDKSGSAKSTATMTTTTTKPRKTKLVKDV